MFVTFDITLDRLILRVIIWVIHPQTYQFLDLALIISSENQLTSNDGRLNFL